ncbi:hypothetical protein K7711_02935 [Nocardia sp. CA2R105]|uniref:TPR repeat region-containing protein n=1 Tax=Nocardia coffeae TaxID=2873381 RepID=UPI001CA6AA71|nr:hypothetical protein [Nocardia coffeae]MBY8855423.1 hypothetical protein [Nocardia coffeae]
MVDAGTTSLLRSNVEKWQPSTLTGLAAALVKDNDETFEVNIDQPKKYFAGLGTSWQGAAYNAAYDRVGEDHDQARKVWTYVDDLATAIKQAASDIDSHRTVLLNKVNDAVSHGLTVADNWVIPDKDGVPAATINDLQDAINQAFYPFRDAVSTAATKISEAAELVRAAGDLFGSDLDVTDAPSAGKRLGAEDGDEAAAAAKNHDTAKLTEVASHLPTNVLTPQQLQDLADGKDVSTLPADVQDYYKEFLQHSGKDGLLALQDQLQQDATATADHPASTAAVTQQKALADGLMAVTNEHLGTGTGPDGKLTSPGSYTNLPSDIRAVISGREEEYNNTGTANADAARQRMLDRSRLANLLSKSDSNMTGGTTFSMETSRQAASMAHYIDSANANGAMPPGFQDQDKNTIQNAANQMLNVGLRNHDADYQLMTGLDAHTGQKIPADLSFGANGNQYTPTGNYDPHKFTQAVFGHDWGDQGKEASGLYGWTADHVHDQGSEGDLARKTIAALPETLAPKNGEALVTADDGKTIFQHTTDDFNKNPELANALARVSASDINAFANVPNSPNALNAAVPLELKDSERLLFLSSQTQDGRHTLDMARQVYENSALAQITSNSDPGLDKNAIVRNLAGLDAHVDAAQRNALIYQEHNDVAQHNSQAQQAHDDNQKIADTVKTVVDKVPLPGGKVTDTVKSLVEDPAYKGLMNTINPDPTLQKVQYLDPEKMSQVGTQDFINRMIAYNNNSDTPLSVGLQGQVINTYGDVYGQTVGFNQVKNNSDLEQLATGGAQAPSDSSQHK